MDTHLFQSVRRQSKRWVSQISSCEKYSCWVIEKVPMLGKLSPAIQQRFINVIDVLYDQNCRLFLLSEYELSEIVFGVEQQDIQRTRSRLSQLNKDILQRNKNYYELSEY